MKDSTTKLMHKAERSMDAARDDLAHGHWEAAANRIYYAMFYAAEAMLNERNLKFRKHGGVHAAFGEHFAKTAELDPKYHRWILTAFNKRIAADYGFDAELTESDIRDLLARATEFVKVASEFLRESSP